MRSSPEGNGLLPLFLPCAASALLLALAMPGRVGWWPLLLVALVPLLLAVLDARPGRGALAGFVFGLLYHLALLYWILIVLGRYGGLPLWATLPALFLLAAYMALYPALFGLFLSLAAGRFRQGGRHWPGALFFAPVLWVGLEYLRSVLLTGFPWMDLGYGLFKEPVLIQAADLGGHHLLSFILVLVNSSAAALIDRLRYRDRLPLRPLAAALAVLALVGGYSLYRYRTLAPQLARAPQTVVTVVQGNIDQAVKWSPATRAATVETYLKLSRQAIGESRTDLLVWPETALPFYPQRDPLVGRVFDFTRSAAAWVLTGAPLFRITPSLRPNGEDEVRFYNGAVLLGPEPRISARYAKQHLVPFGEYVPLRRLLPFLEPVVVSIGDFTAGTDKGPLVHGEMRLGMLICFESIFPQIAKESVVRGANLLVNLTNDAWYGRSSAPHQSMAMAVLRAVENRRALIRAANTGISGFVDPLGRVTSQSELFTEATLTARVPMLESPTVFVRGGSRFGLACAGLIPLLLLMRRRRTE